MVASRELVDRLGGHPSTLLGLDLERDEGLWHWLVTSCLLATPGGRGHEAARACIGAGAARLPALACSDPTGLARRLEESGIARPERVAQTLVRAARALEARHGGSLGALLREAGDAEAVGRSLVALAPGIGSGVALRFLRPLRGRIPGADALPLAAPALAAAACVGWLAPDADAEVAFAALAHRLRDEPDSAPLPDVEAALERLGAASCAKRRAARCPLARSCGLRYRQEP